MHFGLRLFSSKPYAHLVLDIPTLSVKVEGDVEARWVSMNSWHVGGTITRLCLSQQCWESNPDLNVDKYIKTFWTIQIRNHVAYATDMCVRMFERLVLSICNVGWRTVGCCEHVAAVLWYPSYQRNQKGEVLSETNYSGTVNVLDVANTNLDSKCRVNKSPYD